jgi:EAL domain-containing protein (putative c-di-GMP-specific phosphodiesterase class I)
VDIEGSLTSTWPAVARAGGHGRSVCLNLAAGPSMDLGRLAALAAAHREQGALIGLTDVSGDARTLEALEAVRPDIALLDPALTAGLDASRPRRTLVRAIVDCAHAAGSEVVARAIARVGELEALRDLGVEHGGGPLLGETPLQELALGAGVLPAPA